MKYSIVNYGKVDELRFVNHSEEDSYQSESMFISDHGRDEWPVLSMCALAMTAIANEIAEANELKLREIKALEQLAFHGLKPI